MYFKINKRWSREVEVKSLYLLKDFLEQHFSCIFFRHIMSKISLLLMNYLIAFRPPKIVELNFWERSFLAHVFEWTNEIWLRIFNVDTSSLERTARLKSIICGDRRRRKSKKLQIWKRWISGWNEFHGLFAMRTFLQVNGQALHIKSH